MHLSQVWQYPVKSMIGQTVPFAELNELGVVGDRTWAVWETEAGRVANTRQTPGIMRFAAAQAPGGHVTITLPDGGTISSNDPNAATVMSAALGRAVTLTSLHPSDDLDFYRRPEFTGDDFMAHLQGIFGRTDDEPLPDFAKFGANALEFETPPGTFYDCFPLLVMSTSALRSLAEDVPGSVIDVRRFRPSLVIDTALAPGHPEFAWAGQRFSVGTAVIEIVNDCPRCSAITQEITPDIPQDRAILRHVVRDLDQAVGMYANVVQPGTVSLGDPLLPV